MPRRSPDPRSSIQRSHGFRFRSNACPCLARVPRAARRWRGALMTSLTSDVTDAPTTDVQETAAPISDRVPVAAKAAYALGGTTDIFGHWLYNSFANPVFNVFLGLTPTQVSLSLGASRFMDAFTDPLFGWISDNTRTRWGRRRPFILIGSILAGVGLPCLFMASSSWSTTQIFWFMLISACLYAPIISSYNMPYQSLGAELTPDYNERTSVLSWKAVVQKLAGMLIQAGWALAVWWKNPFTGKSDTLQGAVLATAIAGGIMIISGIANFVFVRERYYEKARTQSRVRVRDMISSTFTCKPYLALLGTALVYAIPTGMINTLGWYVSTYYVFHGDLTVQSGFGVWGGVAYTVCGVAGVPVAAGLAKRYGKPMALTCTLMCGIVAFGSSWWLYNPA